MSERQITWDDCIKAADEAIAELARLMNADPAHGVLYQRMMAVMIRRKQYAWGKKHSETT